MKRKTRVLMVLFLIAMSCASLYAQVGDSGNSGGEEQYQVPDITPTNPQTASLGRYGNVPINTATGKMGFTVPIYAINVDGKSWPISLNYSYGGLILESAPSLWGLGWNLNAYGAITKEVRGLPDGHPDGYYGANNRKATIDFFAADWDTPSTATLGDISMFEFIQFLDGKYDSEVDKYTVNIGGMQFSFKLRYDGNTVVPYYLSQHNYKVAVTMSTTEHYAVSSFIVTSDQGVNYYFDADNAESVYTEPVGITKYTEDKNTSWVLSKIVYPNNEEIEFSYTEEIYDSWSYDAWGSSVESTFNQGNVHESLRIVTGYGERANKTQMRRMNIDSITFPEGTLKFETTIQASGRKLYTGITLKNLQNTVVSQYDLSYLGTRDALVDIQNNNERVYGFEYFGTHTPEVIPEFYLSTATRPLDQDAWKYYNNAANEYALNLGSAPYIADKSPDFTSTRLGAMMRILYPTGGYSTISYEPHQVKEDYIESVGNSTVPFNRQLVMRLHPSVDNNEREVVFEYTFDTPTEAYISHRLEGDAFGNLLQTKIEKIDGVPCDVYSCYTSTYDTAAYYYEQAPSMRNVLSSNCSFYPLPVLCPTLAASMGPDDVPSGYGYEEENSGGRVVISPGTYRFTITTRNGAGNFVFATGSMDAEIRVNFYEPPTDPNEPPPAFANVNIGGIRVAKIAHYTDDLVSNEVYYDYNDEEGFSTGRKNHVPQETFPRTIQHLNLNGQDYLYEDIVHSLKAFSFSNEANGVPVYYERVRTYVKQTEVFQPVPPEDIFDTFDIPLATNPDGTRIITVSGPTPPAIVDVNGVAGRYEKVYSEGFTTQEFLFPQEYHFFRYPGVPELEDLTKAVGSEGMSQRYNPDTFDYTTVSSNTTTYERLDFPSTNQEYFNNGKIYNYDLNTDHPWSFKIVVKPVRVLDYSHYNYDQEIPTDPLEIAALKDLHDVHPYREIEFSRRPIATTSYTQGVTTTQTMEYDSYTQLKKQTTVTSEGENTLQEFLYPYSTEITSEQQYQDMIASNIITIPVMTKASQDGTLLATQKTNFTQVQNGFKPSTIESAKANDTLEKRIFFERYDNLGNIQEVRNVAGEYTSFIWGYDNKYVVAKVANAQFISAFAGLDIGILNSPASDAALQLELDKIRQNNPEAQVTTYTYKPLVGVTSVKDPRGYTMYYTYDAQNRLQYVKDQDGKVYSKNEYHYGTSN